MSEYGGLNGAELGRFHTRGNRLSRSLFMVLGLGAPRNGGHVFVIVAGVGPVGRETANRLVEVLTEGGGKEGEQ